MRMYLEKIFFCIEQEYTVHVTSRNSDASHVSFGSCSDTQTPTQAAAHVLWRTHTPHKQIQEKPQQWLVATLPN